MALPSNIQVRPLNDDGMGPNGQGEFRPARNPVQQFLLNVFGAWQNNKPQLYKDVPALDMVTPQIAYATGQGSAEEALAGFGGPASIRGGLQYGRYGRNAINYGAQQGKNFVAREGQQFIKSQAENIVRNPGKTSTGIPFRGAEIQAPIAQGFTFKATPEAMAGMKPGSVKPVVPFSTQARVAAVDVTNAVKGAAGKVANKVASGAKSAKESVTKAGIPLRDAGKNAKNFWEDMSPNAKGYAKAAAGITGLTAGLTAIDATKNSNTTKASAEKKKRDLMYQVPNPGKTNGPTKVSDTKVVTPGGTKSGNINPPAKTPAVTPKVDQKAKATPTVVPKSLQPADSKSKTGTATPTTGSKNPPAKITPKVQLPANQQTLQAAKIAPPTNVPTFGQLSTDYSDTMSAADMERVQGNRAGNNLAPIISKNLPTQQTTSLAQSHPRVLSPQVSKAQLAADAIFTKGRVMGFKKGGILKVKSNG